MAEVDNAFVKRGLWTDWSRGNVMGKTITTDSRTGTIVVSILAILTSLAATHLWHIVVFVVHQARARGRSENGLFWQQQAMLRTLPTPSSLLADNISLCWRWRKRAPQSILSVSFQVLLPLSFSSAAVAITILTSLVVSTSNVPVLVQSPYCSRYNNTKERAEFNHEYHRRTAELAISYRNNCYRDDISSPSFCQNTFIKSRLPLTISSSSCPFEGGVCERDNSTAINMDTGMLDLGSDFGLNLMPGAGMKIRKQTGCTVLPFEKYCKVINTSKDDAPTSLFETQYMGQNFMPGLKSVLAFLGPRSDIPKSYENASIWVPLVPMTSIASRTIRSTLANWKPLPELQKPDADTTIVLLLLNGLSLSQPSDDPLFSAHRQVKINGSNHRNGEANSAYISDYPAGLLGCTEKNEFCIDRGNKTLSCIDIFSDAVPTFLETANPFQKAVFELIQIVSDDATITSAIKGGFNSSERIGEESTFPNDQWIVEAENMMTFNLAYMQVLFSDYAVGPEVRASKIREGVDRPVTEGEHQLCTAQRMRKAGGFVNINLFGLVFISVISTVLVITDLVMLKVLVRLTKVRVALAPRINRWIQEGTLQYQRRAFEAAGQGTWEKLASEVPLTSTNEKLNELSEASILPLRVVPIKDQEDQSK